jgi:DNA-binding NtrC family response regulator
MQLLTNKEVANRLKMPVEWVEKSAASGKMPKPVYLDGHKRWKEKDIDEWIQAGCPLTQTTEKTQNDIGTHEDDLNMKQLERWAIEHALSVTKGNREEAAQLLGIGERTLYRKIKLYGLG